MTLPELAFDHLAIAAASLGEGIDFVERKLGVHMPLGGKHPVMNTHNAVMKLADGLYLEVIAPDPEAPPPLRPRWFGMDTAALRQRLSAEGPRLVAWVVRSPDIAASLAASPVDLGTPLPMSRGPLNWKIAVTADGVLPEGGTLPVMIEWPPGEHPTRRMPDLGVRFAGLTLRAPRPESLRTLLAPTGADTLVDIKPLRRGLSTMEARFMRPDGSEAAIEGGI